MDEEVSQDMTGEDDKINLVVDFKDEVMCERSVWTCE